MITITTVPAVVFHWFNQHEEDRKFTWCCILSRSSWTPRRWFSWSCPESCARVSSWWPSAVCAAAASHETRSAASHRNPPTCLKQFRIYTWLLITNYTNIQTEQSINCHGNTFKWQNLFSFTTDEFSSIIRYFKINGHLSLFPFFITTR